MRALLALSKRITVRSIIHTNNDSENVPMLAVNRKLGYGPEPRYYWVARNTMEP
jgi:hypothetical protein